MIAVVDYGMGNLRSIQKALEAAGAEARITSDPDDVRRADKIVIPGDGAFKDAMENLNAGGLLGPIREALDEGKPYLGICLGMQVLMTESEEFGRHRGLGIIRGRVVRFPGSVGKVPHMGWNSVRVIKDTPLLDSKAGDPYFYFLHSYYPVPEDGDVVAGVTDYGTEFCSFIHAGHIFATQFHPEKSQDKGLGLLGNFVRLGTGNLFSS